MQCRNLKTRSCSDQGLDQELDDRHLQEESSNGTSGGKTTGSNLWCSTVELLWLDWSTIQSVRKMSSD